MSNAWRPIAELLLQNPPEGDIVLSDGWGVMGMFSGVKIDENGTTWFIDDALFDGDSDPEFFFVLPPIPR